MPGGRIGDLDLIDPGEITLDHRLAIGAPPDPMAPPGTLAPLPEGLTLEQLRAGIEVAAGSYEGMISITLVSGLSSVTVNRAVYERIGHRVRVEGAVTLQRGSGTSKELEFSLPIEPPANFAGTVPYGSGKGGSNGTATSSIRTAAKEGAKVARLLFSDTGTSGTNVIIYFDFSYEI